MACPSFNAAQPSVTNEKRLEKSMAAGKVLAPFAFAFA
jgi:hypothetical protein